MFGIRLRIISLFLVPLIGLASGVLAYQTYQTASRAARLGEQTIAESSLLLVREKVEGIEQYIIGQDNAALRFVDLEELKSLRDRWRPEAETVTPSVRAIFVLGPDGAIEALEVRGDEEDVEEFRALLADHVIAALLAEERRVGRLGHLHIEIDENTTHLFSFRAERVRGERHLLVAHHDTGFLVREQIATLFATEEAKRQFNVIDASGRRVFGPSLADAGDYLVGARFPTTLYRWRLQIAPRTAPLLESQRRSRKLTDLLLLVIALGVILIGVGFFVFAALKERRLNALKGEFIANVSHELKTPLSVIRMFGELLLTKRVRNAEKQEQYLEIICRESERLSALIENVLDFSALEGGRQKYELREGDLGELVQQALETFRYRVEREGTEVELVLGEDLPSVQLDEQAIVLSVINLLDNAVKYGGRTPITVHVERVRDFVQVRVRDRGPGIPSDSQKRIFERFFRLKRDAQTRGSGIGLALVRHIAMAHGGRAWARNAEDEDGGAVVGFALPASDIG